MRHDEEMETERQRVLSAITVLNWNAHVSRAFGDIKSRLELAGTPIDDFDVAIAAVAVAHGAEVITANVVHFKRVPNLQVRRW